VNTRKSLRKVSLTHKSRISSTHYSHFTAERKFSNCKDLADLD